jgi:glycosyltransferase involved in cell wall biosynthesis
LRVLHAAVSMNPSIGFIRQMEWEQNAADSLGIPWRSVVYTPTPINSSIVLPCRALKKGRLCQYISLRSEFSKWLRQEASKVDLILLRHSVHDLFELSVLRDLGDKLLTVHHTLEDIELMGVPNFTGRFRSKFESIVRTAILKRVKGIVGVTREIIDYELKSMGRKGSEPPAFMYPNGIVPSGEVIADEREDVPNLLFVARFAPWHGLDLLLDALEKDQANCLINIVGQVPESLHKRCKTESRIILHGPLGQREISSLASKAWCGLSSLALSRNKMLEACTLKVREYLDMGLPVYADHRDAALPDTFPFFRRGPADLAQILEFASECRKVARSDVKQASVSHIDKRILLKRLYEEMYQAFPMQHLGSMQ